MSSQIKFFKRNALDKLNKSASITITDSVATNNGQAVAGFMQNRNNRSAWVTTESTDAALTEVEFSFGDFYFVTDIIIVGHNLKAYTIQYFDEINEVWADFSTPISVTNDTKEVSHFEFTKIETSKLKLVIQGTQVSDSDKIIRQFLAVEKLGAGQLEAWPEIRKPTLSTNKKVHNTLSGLVSVSENVRSFTAELYLKGWYSSQDMDIVEHIFTLNQGFLIWLTGGDESQFLFPVGSFRNENIFFVRAINEFTHEWVNHYKGGQKVLLKVSEAIE